MSLARIADLVYPRLEPLDSAQLQSLWEAERTQIASAESHPAPKSLVEAYAQLHRDEADRLKSVEARLGGILGLASITASILLSGMFALLNGGLSDSGRWVRVVAATALLYLSLQIVCSTIAAVRGMARLTWEYLSVDNLVPFAGIASQEFERQLATQTCRQFIRTQKNVNYKVSQMAVAHTAIRNFAVGSALIAVLGLIGVSTQRPGSAAGKAIRGDAEIQKLLRGAEGPPGPAGPVGPRGKAGSPGRVVKPCCAKKSGCIY